MGMPRLAPLWLRERRKGGLGRLVVGFEAVSPTAPCTAPLRREGPPGQEGEHAKRTPSAECSKMKRNATDCGAGEWQDVRRTPTPRVAVGAPRVSCSARLTRSARCGVNVPPGVVVKCALVSACHPGQGMPTCVHLLPSGARDVGGSMPGPGRVGNKSEGPPPPFCRTPGVSYGASVWPADRP